MSWPYTTTHLLRISAVHALAIELLWQNAKTITALVELLTFHLVTNMLGRPLRSAHLTQQTNTTRETNCITDDKQPTAGRVDVTTTRWESNKHRNVDKKLADRNRYLCTNTTLKEPSTCKQNRNQAVIRSCTWILDMHDFWTAESMGWNVR